MTPSWDRQVVKIVGGKKWEVTSQPSFSSHVTLGARAKAPFFIKFPSLYSLVLSVLLIVKVAQFLQQLLTKPFWVTLYLLCVSAFCHKTEKGFQKQVLCITQIIFNLCKIRYLVTSVSQKNWTCKPRRLWNFKIEYFDIEDFEIENFDIECFDIENFEIETF